jgi:hypothetical protein
MSYQLAQQLLTDAFKVLSILPLVVVFIDMLIDLYSGHKARRSLVLVPVQNTQPVVQAPKEPTYTPLPIVAICNYVAKSAPSTGLSNGLSSNIVTSALANDDIDVDPEEMDIALERMTKPMLLDICNERGIKVPKRATKAVLIAALSR